MKVCLVRLLGFALLAAAIPAGPAAQRAGFEDRTLAVVHLHPASLHSVPAVPIGLPRSAPEVIPGPAAAAPRARPALREARPLFRPVLPWWLHRRHIAAPQSLAA